MQIITLEPLFSDNENVNVVAHATICMMISLPPPLPNK